MAEDRPAGELAVSQPDCQRRPAYAHVRHDMAGFVERRLPRGVLVGGPVGNLAQLCWARHQPPPTAQAWQVVVLALDTWTADMVTLARQQRSAVRMAKTSWLGPA